MGKVQVPTKCSIAAYRKKVPRDLLKAIEDVYVTTKCRDLGLNMDPRAMLASVKERVMYLDQLEEMLKQQFKACGQILDGLWDDGRKK